MYRNFRMVLRRMRRVAEDIPEELKDTNFLRVLCNIIPQLFSNLQLCFPSWSYDEKNCRSYFTPLTLNQVMSNKSNALVLIFVLIFVDDTSALEIIPRNSLSPLNLAVFDIREFDKEHNMKLNPAKWKEMLMTFLHKSNSYFLQSRSVTILRNVCQHVRLWVL